MKIVRCLLYGILFWSSSAVVFTTVLGAPQQSEAAGGQLAGAGSVRFCQDGLQSFANSPSAIASPANNIVLGRGVSNTDYVVAGVGGLRNVGSGVITLAGVTGPVTLALLYWNGPTNSTNPMANAAITVNGSGFVGTNIGFSHDNCWDFANSQSYFVDVTALVSTTGNGNYTITGLGASPSSVPGGANSNGASLIVFFDDGNANNNRDVVIFHGNDSNMPNAYDADGWNVTLSGISYTDGTATMQLHVADGQYALGEDTYFDDALVANGTMLVPAGIIFSGTSVPGDNNGPLNNGKLWDIRSWDVTQLLAPGTNTLMLTTGVLSDCLGLVVAVVDLPSGSAPCVTTLPTPGSPNPPSPSSGQPTALTLVWSVVTDPCAGPVTYDLYFGTSNPPPLLASNLSTNWRSVSGLTSPTGYYWEVGAKGTNRRQSWGPVWNFTTGSQPHGAPSLTLLGSIVLVTLLLVVGMRALK